MSYNCDSWKTKEIDSLRVAFHVIESNSTLKKSDISFDKNGMLVVRYIESTLSGTFDGNTVNIAKIDITGEGSGHAWFDVFKPILEKSTGKLVAVRVWERGDYIDKLTVIDGVVTEEAIDL